MNMEPIDYLRADIAGRFGKDNEAWDNRILFTLINDDRLEDLIHEAKEPILYAQAVRAYRKVQEGQPTGYAVMFDASASGMQLLSILTGDVNGAKISNVTSTERMDPYLYIYEHMLEKVDRRGDLSRDQVKDGIMTSLYGSEAEPKKLFLGNTLDYFYESMSECVPNCWELNTFFLNFLKQSDAISYDWVMPDNFHVHCPVTETVYDEVVCLGKPRVVGRKVQQAHPRNRSLGANFVHSVESFLARELIRRCNFRKGLEDAPEATAMVKKLWALYEASGFFSWRILDYINTDTIKLVDYDVVSYHLNKRVSKPFPIKAIHDCFGCTPSNASHMLNTYRDLYSELNQSNMLNYLLQQVLGYDPNLKINPLKGIEEAQYILS